MPLPVMTSPHKKSKTELEFFSEIIFAFILFLWLNEIIKIKIIKKIANFLNGIKTKQIEPPQLYNKLKIGQYQQESELKFMGGTLGTELEFVKGFIFYSTPIP